jgi:sigma-B regulation protein RsbU (phosphoserine phosphatase)
MELLAKLSSEQPYANPLSILLDVVKTEIPQFKLAMISSHNLDPATFQITGFCNEYHCPIYSAEEMLNGSANLPVFHGEFIDNWKTQSTVLRISCESCPDLFQDELKFFGEALVIPIWINGKVERWIILVDYDIAPIGFKTSFNDEPDLTKLSLLLNYVLTNILRSEQKRQLDKARTWIDEELQEISRLQSLLLPKSDLKIEDAELAFTFKAFKEAGGDYLDLFQLPFKNNDSTVIKWGGIIADVTGHGPSAAVEAAMVDAILRTFPGNKNTTPADAANYLNKHFFTRRDRGKFVTAMLFSYQSDTKILKYVSAGHPNGYIKRGNEVILLDQSKGIPIGVLPDYQWDYQEVKMLSGDILFIYTDVVLETRNLKELEFGENRLFETIKQAPNCPHKLVEYVEQELHNFNEKGELLDDLTLAAIKVL